MNDVKLTGTVTRDAGLRKVANGRELLDFDVIVDGPRGRDPIVHVAFFPRNFDVRKVEAGCRVFVDGALRHRFDTRLYVAARTVRVLDSEAESHWPPVSVKEMRPRI